MILKSGLTIVNINYVQGVWIKLPTCLKANSVGFFSGGGVHVRSFTCFVWGKCEAHTNKGDPVEF